MPLTLGQVAEALGAEAQGDLSLPIRRPAEPARCGPEDLALAMEPKFGETLGQGQAVAAIVWPDADWQAMGLKGVIIAPRSRYVMAGVTRVFELPPEVEPGIHPTAIIDPDAQIGDGAAIGPFVVIGAGVTIGARARILSHCSIAEGATLGADALLYNGVRVGARVRIGDGFICQAGTVIGADGFSYVTPKPGAVEEARATGQITEASRTAGFVRINSLGSVVIGDHVEMGANCTIDRGTVADTVIGDGTKLDNAVHIGHNVTVGRTCLLCGQVGIAGSTTIGDRVVLGGQVGVADHLNVGSDVIAAGKSGISSHVPSNRVVMGNPAMRMDLNVESYKALRRLPRLVAKVEKLQKLVSKTAPNE
ncbi:UDP-3-O-(3-hydroxymyristoyl)glucosamine N-acyltransferase [Oceanomicrobium pacificus]|uniref:UDP-3-O-acylglucosamine N-acyltransferase n=1 Tax=Oceanomicrobium pacificus TaxID=2692916 RepID=A0A6B0TQL5_9RHOB|nr:UDP-3-O-(3-hydroxymyristoyl)glucosamine N-acyltransferase [Oceanomicrobium pacificus]MXU66246.1 UDP-3-O-(3-hydroxymyristoyl)glucosamine N-acyltransferase [Oceanomicrobium pacificus]